MSDITLVEKTQSVVNTDKREEQVFTDKEKDDLFTKLLLGQEATGDIETSRGKFTIKFPKEKDMLAIGRLMSVNRGGLPANSFDEGTENRNLICSTLNVLVTGAPKWFEDAKKEAKNFSFEEVPDEEFLLELYQKACSFRGEVQKRFKEKKGTEPTGISTTEGMANTMDAGFFNGAKDRTSS